MKKYLLSLLCLLYFHLPLIAKTVGLVIASTGYQPLEYSVPKKILEKAGINVITISNRPGYARTITGEQATVDITLQNVDLNQLDGLFFIGGPGALYHLDNTTSHNLIKKAFGKNKLVGAICISPRILAKSGILTGKNATGWDGDGQLFNIFKRYNVHYIRNSVVVEGNIITASGPPAAHEFGQQIVTLLQ